MANEYNFADSLNPRALPDNVGNTSGFNPDSLFDFSTPEVGSAALDLRTPDWASQFQFNTPDMGTSFGGGDQALGGFGGFMNKLGGGDVTNEPGFMNNMFGYINKDTGQSVKGFGGGAFDLLKAGAGGYLAWKNMKQAEEDADFRKEAWMKNYQASKHAYNEQILDRNVARASRRGGARQGETLA